ncbi:MAG: hypothetical protein WAV98_01020 [Minisyncoccia bacterium]
MKSFILTVILLTLAGTANAETCASLTDGNKHMSADAVVLEKARDIANLCIMQYYSAALAFRDMVALISEELKKNPENEAMARLHVTAVERRDSNYEIAKKFSKIRDLIAIRIQQEAR